MSLLDRLAALIPAVDCCPHDDLDDDTALPSETTHRDYTGSI